MTKPQAASNSMKKVKWRMWLEFARFLDPKSRSIEYRLSSHLKCRSHRGVCIEYGVTCFIFPIAQSKLFAWLYFKIDAADENDKLTKKPEKNTRQRQVICIFKASFFRSPVHLAHRKMSRRYIKSKNNTERYFFSCIDATGPQGLESYVGRAMTSVRYIYLSTATAKI